MMTAASAPEAEVTTAVFAIASSAFGGAVASTLVGPWETVTTLEIMLGAGGGLLGGVAYAFARRMKNPVTIFVSITLASAWCGLLAPIVTHVAAMIYPTWRIVFFDAVVTFGVGGVIGACGMTFYEGLLAIFDALAKALPDRMEDIINRFFPPRAKGDK